MQPIVGTCYIGVFPGKHVIGLSKFNRIVRWISQRPQIQEEMTMQIADKLEEINYSKGLVDKGGIGNINRSNEVFLRPNTSDKSGGIGSMFKTTTRITDSVAMYLPADVKDNTAATYSDMETGIVGLVAAGGGQFLNAMRRNDYESAFVIRCPSIMPLFLLPMPQSPPPPHPPPPIFHFPPPRPFARAFN